MSQVEDFGGLEQMAGYVLKRAATALRVALDTELRPLDLTVPQYACLELLGRRPGLSNAELARGAFVTRQSTNLVLRGLQERGLVTRPATATLGRVLPTDLTPAGRRELEVAARAVREVEVRMLSGLSPARQRRLRDDLVACVAALGSTPTRGSTESSSGAATAMA